MNPRLIRLATRTVRTYPLVRHASTFRAQACRTQPSCRVQEAPLHEQAILAALLASAATASAYADAQRPSLSPSILEDDSLSVLSRTEPQTGVQFPLALPETLSLQGTGVRLMGGLVRVYAVGLYVDPTAARSALSDWTGFSRDDILSSDALWDSVCDANAPFRRTFRMVVVREVGSKHMRDGFDRALKPRVAAASKKGRCKPAECKKAVRQFTELFMSVGTMKVGSDIRMSIENGTVSLTIDGRWLGEVKNPQLAWALADTFLGGKSVAPTLRQSSASALETLLKE